VVDNASCDGSTQAVRRDFPEVKVLALPADFGVQAYNVGARAAQTRYVAFSDDASWWERDGLERASQLLADDPTIGMLAGSVCAPLEGSMDRLDEASERFEASRAAAPGTPVLGFVDCFCLVRRQPFLDVGGFDNVAGFGAVQQRVALDMADAGWAVRFRADFVVWQARRSTVRSRIRRVRDDVLTALMRRPMRVALTRTRGHLKRGVIGWSGVSWALSRLPFALRRRRLLSMRIELRARALEAGRCSAGTRS
jgi:GT2 family glycosyltransferase